MTINELFAKPKRQLLNIYFTAGYPEKESMLELLPALEKSGVDMVEIGIPYSDPLSDGPTIQNSNSIALKNGITLDLIFEQLTVSDSRIPKIMMGYFNSVLQYGVEKFCKKCKENKISGIILPDLPLDIYKQHYQSLFEQYGLSNIYLITPQTTEERIRLIDKNSTSFIYAVSTSSTTGSNTGIQGAQNYLQRIQNMNLKSPIMIGFNIKTSHDFQFACRYATGGIIGSAFIKYIANSREISLDTQTFIQSILPKK